MKLLSSRMGILMFTVTVLAPLVATNAGLQEVDICAPDNEGLCRNASQSGYADLCGSGRWLQIPKGVYECFDGQMRAVLPTGLTSVTSPVTHGAATASISRSPQHPGEATGYSKCKLCSETNARRSDRFGEASFVGTMASVYDALPDGPFRCDLAAPANGFYAAFWTPYTANLASQPKPMNCGTWLQVTNPLTGKTAKARVIDRCASCVGVGRQLDDPTTPDYLSNGATIDLSRALWNFLFNDAPASVYDIEYSGPVYGGSTKEPAALTSPDCGGLTCPESQDR